MNRWRSRLAELKLLPVATDLPVQNAQFVENSPATPEFEHSEQIEHIKCVVGANHVWTDAHDERAAVIECDGGVRREWAEAFARLDPRRPPGDVPLKRWWRFLGDAGRFLDAGWGGRCTALGWQPLDLFGCDRNQPFERIERAGLIWLLDGGRLAVLGPDSAVIETASGARQTYHRIKVHGASTVLVWELR